jgi:hypothetical protein
MTAKRLKPKLVFNQSDKSVEAFASIDGFD